MSSLGIKIGSEIFAATATPHAAGRQKADAIRRQAVLFWRPGQQAELRPVGAVAASPAEAEIAGFVDRVGDPVEVVASDGSAHRAEDLVAAGVAFLTRYMAGAFDDRPAISVSYPNHWDAQMLAAFERSLENAGLSAARRVPESQAILASARAMRGVPSDGTLVVYDLGTNGLSLTLASAGTWEQIGTTLRSSDFGSAQTDYSILRHVLNLSEDEAGEVDYDDPATVRELALLRDKCRVAKEVLSTETATVIDVELGRFRDGIRLVRSELEEMIREPMQRSAELIREVLRTNNVDVRSLSGIVLAGGGASIPVVTEFLSSEFRVPVVRDQDPGLTSANGAAIAPEVRPPTVEPTPSQPFRAPTPAPAIPPSPPPISTPVPAPPPREFPPPPPPPASWSAPSDSPSDQPKPKSRVPVAGVVIAVASVLFMFVIGAMVFSGGPEPVSTQSDITTTSRQAPPPPTTPTQTATPTGGPGPTNTGTTSPPLCPDGTPQPCSTPPELCPDGTPQPCTTPPELCPDGTPQPCTTPPELCPDGTPQPCTTPPELCPDGTPQPCTDPPEACPDGSFSTPCPAEPNVPESTMVQTASPPTAPMAAFEPSAPTEEVP